MVHVGGNTDIEQKELYDRVDDAVCAVKSALEEGILPGSGLALYNLHKDYFVKAEIEKISTKKIAYAILAAALVSPLAQILENAGLHVDDIYHSEVKMWGYGYDVKQEKYGQLIKLGVIDPVKVTRSALENAVSVATTISAGKIVASATPCTPSDFISIQPCLVHNSSVPPSVSRTVNFKEVALIDPSDPPLSFQILIFHQGWAAGS